MAKALTIEEKRNAVNGLIIMGARRKRALEIVDVTEDELAVKSKKERVYRAKKRAKKYASKNKSPYKPRIVKPWRCPGCKKLIEIERCIYCRDRESLKLKGCKI